MRTIHVEKASGENFKEFGQFERLTDTDIAQGDGWDCWLTEGPCLDKAGRFSFDEVRSVLPCTVSEMNLNGKGQMLFVAGTNEPVVYLVAPSLVKKDELNSAGIHQPDMERAHAFLLEPGDIMVLRQGVWYDSGHTLKSEDAVLYRIGQISADDPVCRLSSEDMVRLTYES